MSVPTRIEAYKAALAKTAGRRFDAAGQPILTDDERAMLKGLERADFAEAFQRAIGLKMAMMRLEAIFQRERNQKGPPARS